MKKAAYSLVLAAMVTAYLLVGALTQIAMGIIPWSDLLFFFFISIVSGVIIGGLLYFIYSTFESKTNNPQQIKISKKFINVSLIFIAISASFGVIKSYSTGREQQLSKQAQQEVNEKRKIAAANAIAAEQKRLSELTPEQRKAEEQEARKKTEAANQLAAEQAKRIEDEKIKIAEKEKKHASKLQFAAYGAMTLKNAAKDPESFELKSALLMPNGTVCYDYRAKNSFGAILPSSAVLTASGKMLLKEADNNTFAKVWNKNCLTSDGEDLLPIFKKLRLLNK